ncbi:MAG: DUF2799 domain-containing protein [Gammaproteobacteria bacterium]|nr:DUF2799 domain-containing protein [Gammaproteobacteria bacterium]
MIKTNIRHHKKVFLCAAFSCLTLSGCQIMSVGECQTADWFKIGQQDGNVGQADNIGKRVDSCREQNVAIASNSVNAYRTGYMQGLRNYCQPHRILDDAIAGRDHVNVCPLEVQNGLRPFAQAGMRVYSANQRIKQINDQQSRLSTELQQPQTTEKRAWEIKRQQRQLLRDLDDAVVELQQARIMLGTL